ncbi:MAG: S8 family serine peptidase, partial [FCB group bacterium]|nr:S8 family serine peptidase [FCB group bacterium]
QADGRYKTWVYFVDKGVFPDAGQGSRVRLHPNTVARRMKMGLSGAGNWFDQWPADEYVTTIRKTGAEIRRRSRWLNAVSVVATETQLETIATLPFVKELQPVFTYRRAWEKPSGIAPGASRVVADSLDYGSALAQIEQINCRVAHDSGYVGQGVIVLVMDTGFNLAHPAFDSLEVIGEWDFVDDDSVTANQTTADSAYGQHDHGTMVLSTLAAYAPGKLIGPAYGARFLLAKTEIIAKEIRVEEDNYVAGLEWGEANGADVVSSSLGYLDWYEYSDLDGNTAVTTKAVDIAVGLGLVCVTAAGNEGNRPWHYIITPADADSVISVGAVTSIGTIADFSSRGPTYDNRIKPEVCALGVNTVCVNPNSNGYKKGSGTSLATPLVGGSAAVILSAHPDWTPMMVREALLQTASRADNPNNIFGYGIINVWAAINYDRFQDTSDSAALPTEYTLSPVYPNPFNLTARFTVGIPESGFVQLSVFDITGRQIGTLLSGDKPAGNYEYSWNGERLSSGVYILRLNWDKGFITRKVTLLK